MAGVANVSAKRRRRWGAIKTAAHHSDLSETSIRRMLGSGILTSHRPLDKILVDLDELDAVIEATANAAPGNRGKHLLATESVGEGRLA